MKKTNSMRVAVAMLALTLITSCFVGGTFAKYTTSASGNDVARVAKFGVKIEGPKNLFKTQYDKDDNTIELEGGLSVISVDGANVVAPGTSGEITLFSISGSPEVAVKVTTKMTHDDDTQSIWLNPIKEFQKVITVYLSVAQWEDGGTTNIGIGSGTDDFTYDEIPPSVTPTKTKQSEERGESVSADGYQTRPTGSTVTGETVFDEEQIGWETYKTATTTETVTEYEPQYDEEKYYPIKWTLKKGEDALITSGKLSDVKAYFDDDKFNKVYAPGDSLSGISGIYTLAWEWSFEGGNDTYDTALGNIMAGELGIYAAGDYNLNESFEFTINVVQVD